MVYTQTIERSSNEAFPKFIVLDGERVDWEDLYLDWYQSINPADPKGFRILTPELKAKLQVVPVGKNPFGTCRFTLTVQSTKPFSLED